MKRHLIIYLLAISAAAYAGEVTPESFPLEDLDRTEIWMEDTTQAAESIGTPLDESGAENSAESVFETDRFDELLNESKVHFVNALIADHFNDSLEVQLQLRLSFEVLTDIEIFNNLNAAQYEELYRFTTRLISDFNKFAPEAKALSDQFSVNDLRLAMDDIAEDFVEVGDKDSIRIIEDREGHLPIILNSRVERMISFFQTQGKDNFQEWLNRKLVYEPAFKEILSKYGVPEELLYLSMIESGFKPNAYSYAQAMGQWQFMYYTGKLYGLKRDYWVDERMDFIKATDAAARHLNDLHDDLGDWYLAMAAYNAGAGRIRRAISREGTRDFWKMRLLPKQTRNYVPTVLAAAIICRNPEDYGFSVNSNITSLSYDTLTIGKSIEIESIARACDVKYDDIKYLNPELRKHSTPNRSYTVRVPKGSRDKFLVAYENIDEVPTVEYYTHRVKRGETLSRISRKYGVSVRDIMSANKLGNKQPILIGQKLVIPVPGTVVPSTERITNQPDYSATRDKIVYRVKKGDTLGHIAEMHNTSASNIRTWNNLRYGQYIYPNQKLVIWVSKKQIDGDGYYIVQNGDTLTLISQKTGVSLDELKRLNPSINYSKIFPGDKIKVNAAN